MADDRPVEDPTDAVGRLQTELDDLRSTVLARITRRPTGDVEPTIRSTPKDKTLLLDGQLVSRDTYAGLWTWAQDTGLVITGLFTTGDGTTTFGLPDFRGRVPITAGTLDTETYPLGALGGLPTRVITEAQMPAHQHTGTTSQDGDHVHGGTTGVSGDHPGHNFTGTAAGGTQIPYGQAGGGAHTHGFVTLHDGLHYHGFWTSTVGGNVPFDVRQPYIAINWLIWV